MDVEEEIVLNNKPGKISVLLSHLLEFQNQIPYSCYMRNITSETFAFASA